MADSEVYFRQWLAGRDFARDDPAAAGMVNFVYALGDRRRGEAVLVDPAWAVAELVGLVEADGLRLVGVLATHHHADHVGGSLMGHPVEGVAELLALRSVPVHAHEAETASIAAATGLSASDLVGHSSGDLVDVGEVEIRLLHTPGHTPGSQCFLLDRLLVSGDTLFLEGCGRTDLPGSDPEAMYDSLALLASLPDDVAVLPGHRYSLASSATLEAVRSINQVLKPTSRAAWLAAFSA